MQVMQSTEHELLEAAYLFYYATSAAFEENSEWLNLLKLRLLNLIGDALVIADQVSHYHFPHGFNRLDSFHSFAGPV